MTIDVFTGEYFDMWAVYRTSRLGRLLVQESVGQVVQLFVLYIIWSFTILELK